MIKDIADSSGTSSQIEWASLIKRRVAAEFGRVGTAFRVIAGNQDDRRRARTEAVLLILEEIRATVMANDQAGYFIRDWQGDREPSATIDLARCPLPEHNAPRRPSHLGLASTSEGNEAVYIPPYDFGGTRKLTF